MNPAPDDCPDCQQALAATWHGGYRANCMGCAARAAARTLAAINADQPGVGPSDTADLRDTYARMLPGVPLRDAHEAMLTWWRRDHDHLTQQTE